AVGGGATLEITIRNAAGTQRHTRTLTAEANQFDQQPGHAFAGTTLLADDSIEVKLTGGNAIVYATTVDNQTNDSSLQLLKR
ncbi:MAG: hypothetical protein ACLGH0_12540, partial [Thermoanaerobaculia bacterium]